MEIPHLSSKSSPAPVKRYQSASDRVLISRLFALLFLAGMSPLAAETGSWSNADPNNNFWDNNANWSGLTYPGAEAGNPGEFPDDPLAVGDSATLGNLGSNQSIDLNNSTIVLQRRPTTTPPSQNAIFMSASPYSYTLEGNGTLRLYAGAAEIPPVVQNSSDNVLTFGSGVDLVFVDSGTTTRHFATSATARIDVLGTVDLDTTPNNKITISSGTLRFAGSGTQLVGNNNESNVGSSGTIEFSNPDFAGQFADNKTLSTFGGGRIAAVNGNDRFNGRTLSLGSGTSFIDSNLIVTNNVVSATGTTFLATGTTLLVEGTMNSVGGTRTRTFSGDGATMRWENASANTSPLNFVVTEGSMIFNVALNDSASFTVQVGEVAPGTAGTFGGNGIIRRSVLVSSSDGRIMVGDHSVAAAQTFTFTRGLNVTDGANFSFRLGGTAGANDLLDITGGTLSLTGDMVVDLFDLGLSPVQANQTYTLINAVGIGGTLSQWDVGLLPSGWGGAVFSTNTGDELLISFNVIPEPSSTALLAMALLSLAVRKRMTGRKRA